jgi:hypothetical protein
VAGGRSLHAEPGTGDIDLWQKSAHDLLLKEAEKLTVPLEMVGRAMLTLGYPAEQIVFVKGLVEETIPAQARGAIALLRLDTDWYESTRHELEHLYPRLAPHGVLIIDDYGHWQGARRAVDEYLGALEEPLLLNRIDYSGRIAVKPPG